MILTLLQEKVQIQYLVQSHQQVAETLENQITQASLDTQVVLEVVELVMLVELKVVDQETHLPLVLLKDKTVEVQMAPKVGEVAAEQLLLEVLLP
jgi:hypothetical protein